MIHKHTQYKSCSRVWQQNGTAHTHTCVDANTQSRTCSHNYTQKLPGCTIHPAPLTLERVSAVLSAELLEVLGDGVCGRQGQPGQIWSRICLGRFSHRCSDTSSWTRWCSPGRSRKRRVVLLSWWCRWWCRSLPLTLFLHKIGPWTQHKALSHLPPYTWGHVWGELVLSHLMYPICGRCCRYQR